MIALAADCLLFEVAGGQSVPLSSDMITVELMGDTASLFEEEFVRHAAQAVFHYFKEELGRKSVTVGEFAGALEKVMGGFKLAAPAKQGAEAGGRVAELDLCRLAQESEGGGELIFFPRLRQELRGQLRRAPQVLRLRGLRGCVKELAGTRTWCLRCRDLEEQIVAYLRECLRAERCREDFTMVVE